ncbi:Trm112 family protein [Gammaproteobacteria bacterium]|nr:Trm112 family protein [Gammaproteobacteria bacterium]
MPVDKKLLAILVCPICKGNLTYERENEELVCHAQKLAFPIQDDIPIMLESEARRMEVDELS